MLVFIYLVAYYIFALTLGLVMHKIQKALFLCVCFSAESQTSELVWRPSNMTDYLIISTTFVAGF